MLQIHLFYLEKLKGLTNPSGDVIHDKNAQECVPLILRSCLCSFPGYFTGWLKLYSISEFTAPSAFHIQCWSGTIGELCLLFWKFLALLLLFEKSQCLYKIEPLIKGWAIMSFTKKERCWWKRGSFCRSCLPIVCNYTFLSSWHRRPCVLLEILLDYCGVII